MIAKPSKARPWFFILFAALAASLLGDGLWSPRSRAQVPKPVLFSQMDSTRAIAVNSVTRTHEPFPVTEPISFGVDA